MSGKKSKVSLGVIQKGEALTAGKVQEIVDEKLGHYFDAAAYQKAMGKLPISSARIITPAMKRKSEAFESPRPKRGGVRPNAGAPRKEEVLKNRSMRFNDEDWAKLKALGGAQWVREQLWHLEK